MCCGLPQHVEFASGHRLYRNLVRPVDGAVIYQHNSALQLRLEAESTGLHCRAPNRPPSVRRPLKKVFGKSKAKALCTDNAGQSLVESVFSAKCSSLIHNPVTDSWVCAACQKCSQDQMKRTSPKNKLQPRATKLVEAAGATRDEETGSITTHRVSAFSRVRKAVLSPEEKRLRAQNETAARRKGKSSETKVKQLTAKCRKVTGDLRQAQNTVNALTKQLTKFGAQRVAVAEDQSTALRTICSDKDIQAKLSEMFKGSPVAQVSCALPAASNAVPPLIRRRRRRCTGAVR